MFYVIVVSIKNEREKMGRGFPIIIIIFFQF